MPCFCSKLCLLIWFTSIDVCGKEGNWIHHKWHLWFSFHHHRISCLLCWLCAICDRDGCSIFGEPTLPSLKWYNFAHRQIIVLMLWSLCWQSKDLIRPFICSGSPDKVRSWNCLGTYDLLVSIWSHFDNCVTQQLMPPFVIWILKGNQDERLLKYKGIRQMCLTN